MTGAAAFPFPDDDPAAVAQLAGLVSGWADAVAAEATVVDGVGTAFDAHWEGAAARLAATELTAIGAFSGDAEDGLIDASAELLTWASALDTARADITALQGRYDGEVAATDQSRRDLRESLADEPQLLQVALQELQWAHDGRLGGLHGEYDAVLADLETRAALIGRALIDVAGRLSPDPESRNPELARVRALDDLSFMAVGHQVTVVPTPNGVIVTGTDGDDHVTVERDPSTGEYVVVVNGQHYVLTEEQARQMAIRTLGGTDVVDVDPDIQIGVTVSGGEGKDLLAGGGGTDTLWGGDGADDLIGGRGNDAMAGGDGFDDLADGVGWLGVATLGVEYGGRTVRTRTGGGRDTMAGNGGEDDIDGGAGGDRIRGGSGADEITGGTGNDTIDAGAGEDVVEGNAGDDDIDAGDGRDYVDAGAGDDSIDAGTGDDVVYASTGADEVVGGSGRDYLDGGSGADDVDGGLGADMVSGGLGDDRVRGGAGADVLYTGPGADVAVGGDGVDHVYAEVDEEVVGADDVVERVEIDRSLLDAVEVDSDDPEYIARVESDLVTMASSPTGSELLIALDEQGEGVTVVDAAPGDDTLGQHVGGVVTYPPHVIETNDGIRPPITTLHHELIHAYHHHADDHAEGVYVGPNQQELPDAAALDTDGNGRIDADELDTDGDGDVDIDMDLDGDGDVDRDDGWTPNGELQTVGLPYDDDQDPNTPDVVAEEPALTENALRDELGWPIRREY